MSTTKKKSAPRKETARAARVKKIAAGVLGGKTQAAIAADLQVSRKTVQRDLETPAVQAVIIGLVSRHQGQVDRQFERALAAIDDALDAEQRQIVKLKDADGGERTAVQVTGPDHYARLAAVKRHLEIVTAGRQSIKPEDKPREKKGLSIADMAEALAAAEPALIARFEREAEERRRQLQ